MKIDFDKNLYNDFVKQIEKLKTNYNPELIKLNGFSDEKLDFTSFIDAFTSDNKIADISIDPNANSDTQDITSLINDMCKPHLKLLAFNKIYYETKKKYGVGQANKWLEGEWIGKSYMHDASSSTFLPYCYAVDLDQLVEKGLFFINKFKATAAKHLTTFNDHCLEYVSWLSNRQAGAIGLPSYLVYSFYFWKKDVENDFYLKSPEYYKKQCFQKFIYDLNQPYLRITQSAFTNITIMDRLYLEELFGGRQYPDGSFVIDYIDEIMEYQKSFIETVKEVRKEMMMTFPVITFSLLKDKSGKFVDEEFAKWACEANMEWCDANFYISDSVTTLSSCCRLTSNLSDVHKKKLNGFINSIGGTQLSIGSVKVNTINLRRLALDSGKDTEKFFLLLHEQVDTTMKALDIVRNIIKRNIEKGLLPNYSYELLKLENQYCTIGITAMYETIMEFGGIATDVFGNKYYTEEGLNLAQEILDKINTQKEEFDVDYSFNVEAIPAETANVILRKKDDLFYQPFDGVLYSNQWIPLAEKCTINEKVKLASILDKRCGGGQISHINLEGDFSSFEQAWKILNYLAQKDVIYTCFNKLISVCEDGHGFIGDKCPKCGKPVMDKFTRIVGFLTPSKSYSKERFSEFKNRKWLNLSTIENSMNGDISFS